MTAFPRFIRRAAFKFALLLLATVLVTACGNSLKWTEDVLLPDGRVVTLTRYQEFKGPHMPGEPPAESYYWFEFKHPETGEKVRWEAQTEPGTVALMINKGVVMLLAKPMFGGGIRDFGCPNPRYLLYRYGKNKWERVDVALVPFKRLRSNMTYSPGDKENEIKRIGHLGVDVTNNSVDGVEPWIMDFTDIKQTFHPDNCLHEPDKLLVK